MFVTTELYLKANKQQQQKQGSDKVSSLLYLQCENPVSALGFIPLTVSHAFLKTEMEKVHLTFFVTLLGFGYFSSSSKNEQHGSFCCGSGG